MNLLLTYKPFHVLLGVVGGVLWYFSSSFTTVYLLLLLLIAIGLLKNIRVYKWFFIVVVTSFFLGILSSYISDEVKRKDHYEEYLTPHSVVKLEVSKLLKNNRYVNRCYVKVVQVDSVNTSGIILLEYHKKVLLTIGNELLVLGANFSFLPHAISPFHFNYSAYLQKQGVHKKVSLKGSALRVGSRNSFQKYLFVLHKKINEAIEKSSLSNNSIAIIQTLVLGDDTRLDNKVKQNFINAGIVHIMAISGMHVGILYTLLMLLFSPIKKRHNGLFEFLIILILLLYAVFTGLSSSVTRAVIMFSFFTLGGLKNRQSLPLEAIVFSALLILLFNPTQLFDVGFQLSYAAVIAIVSFYPLIKKLNIFKVYVLRFLMDVLLISLIAQLGVMPLCLHYFDQFPLHFLIANILVLPIVPLLFSGGLVMVFKAMILPYKFALLDHVYNALIAIVLKLVNALGNIEQVIVKTWYLSELEVLACVLLYFAMYLLLQSIRFVKYFLGFVLTAQVLFIVEKHNVLKNENILIFNLYKKTLIISKEGDLLKLLYHKNIENAALKKYSLPLVKKMSGKIYQPAIKNIFKFKGTYYFVLNKDKSKLPKEVKENIVLVLTENTKVNLNRLLDQFCVSSVIVDGSNYSYIKEKWKETCLQKQIPFHDTSLNGAYFKAY